MDKQQMIEQLTEDRAELAAARERLSGVLLGNGYVVRCQGLTLSFTVDPRGNASAPKTCPLLRAPRYTKRDAETLAAATKNGNGVQGEAVHIVDALDYSIAEVDRLLGVLKGE